MRKILLLLLVFVSSTALQAQNIQTHYDLGHGRKYLTTTVEMFKPDKLGNTFFFIDFDYGSNNVEGVSLAYFEIARCFQIKKSPISWHAEYNGGFGQWQPGSAYQINDAWLTGLDYSWNSADFSRGFSLKALYKYIRNTMDDQPNNFQLTGVWHVNFAKGKLSFTGFADFWKEKTTYGSYIFLSEPQLWYNITSKFAAGSEVELSSDFGGMEGFNVMPTIAAKYTF